MASAVSLVAWAYAVAMVPKATRIVGSTAIAQYSRGPTIPVGFW